MVFRGESEGVFGDKIAVGDAGGGGGTSDCAEGGVVVVRGDAVLEGMVEDLGDVLVAVVGVEEIEIPILGTHDERSCGDGLGGIPHELSSDGVAVGGIQPLDAEEVVVDEAEVRGDLTSTCLLVVHAAAHAVEGHGDHGVAGLPADGAVFGIVQNRPNAGLGLDEGLISIVVVLGREVVNRGVLIEIVGGVGLAFSGGAVSHLAYARGRIYSDVVVGIGGLIGGNQFIADVVAVLLVIFRGAAAEETYRSP